MAGAAATSAVGFYYGSKQLEQSYPPKSNAPKFNSIVDKRMPDGSFKQLRVITASGHDTETCHKIQKMLETNTMKEPLYHTRSKKTTQGYARDTGSLIYIGIDKDFPYQDPENSWINHVPFEEFDQRYENSGYFPISVAGLNDQVDGIYSNGKLIKKKPDFQVVYIEKVTPENKVGLYASAQRMMAELANSGNSVE